MGLLVSPELPIAYLSYYRRAKGKALELYKSEWPSIDLVIIDIVMPHMGGRETFEAMHKINPDVNVLLSSGYSIDGEAQAILETGAKGFIQKPFRAHELLSMVQEVGAARHENPLGA